MLCKKYLRNTTTDTAATTISFQSSSEIRVYMQIMI